MDLRVQCLCVDTTDPARLAGSWQEALGWRRTHAADDEVVPEPPEGSAEDGVIVARLEGPGARRVDVAQGEQTWVVLADPDGNELCVLSPLSAEETPGQSRQWYCADVRDDP